MAAHHIGTDQIVDILCFYGNLSQWNISDYYYYRYMLKNALSEPGGKATGGWNLICVLPVPSQYARGSKPLWNSTWVCIASAEPVCQGGQNSLEFNTSPRGPQLTLGINAKGKASIAATMPSLARTSILQ